MKSSLENQQNGKKDSCILKTCEMYWVLDEIVSFYTFFLSILIVMSSACKCDDEIQFMY